MSTRPIKTTPAPLTTLSSMSGFTILSTNGWYAMCCGSTPTTLMPRARSRVAICGPTPPTPITSAFFLLGSTSVRGLPCQFSSGRQIMWLGRCGSGQPNESDGVVGDF